MYLDTYNTTLLTSVWPTKSKKLPFIYLSISCLFFCSINHFVHVRVNYLGFIFCIFLTSKLLLWHHNLHKKIMNNLFRSYWFLYLMCAHTSEKCQTKHIPHCNWICKVTIWIYWWLVIEFGSDSPMPHYYLLYFLFH